MATIAVKPLVLKDVLLKIGADNYEQHVSSVKFVPASSTVQWQGLTPDASFSDVAAPTYTCVLEFVQDWETANSLSRYLWDNQGTTKAAEFVPIKGVGKLKVGANLVIVPGAIGGAVNTFATDSVTLGSDKPVLGTVAA